MKLSISNNAKLRSPGTCTSKPPMRNTGKFAAVLLLPLLMQGCTWLVFFPEREFIDSGYLERVRHEDVFFRSSDGTRLHGWFLRPKNTGPARGTILHLHGNAENLSTHTGYVLWLVEEGYNVFVFDYRGYGKSAGKPSMKGVHLDAEAALEKALGFEGVEGGKFFIFGQSIGGAIAIYTVANTPYKKKIDVLVVESVFSGYRTLAEEKMASCFLTWPLSRPLALTYSDYYSPARWIEKVSPAPLLILHGTGDGIIPVGHGRALYRQAGEPKEMWETSPPGHTRSFSDEETRKRFLQYLEEIN